MDIKYSPKDLESNIYKKWTENDCFSAKDFKSNYSIVLPPPNVTGTLHMGHAFQHTIIDILIRYNRMLGKSVLWQPGTDHAGIATQLVVENNLRKNGKTRHEIGRDALVDEIWKWKEQSGNAIISQTKRLGSSADWDRNRFTMDDGSNEAVKKVFIELYNDGLIYRGNRLVNWDIKLQTAISDLEVTNTDKNGHLYYIKYKLEDSDENLIVATTRPETLFGDSAICVNPKDSRYESFIGRKAMDIEGLGGETVSLLFHKGLLFNIADLYKLKKEQILPFERMAEKSVNNLLEGIENSKIKPFSKVLFGLGIRYVGETVAKRLANAFGSIKALRAASLESLTKTDEIGERIAESIITDVTK